MIVKKANGKVYGAQFTSAEQKAMNMEIQRQCAEYDRKNANEIDAMILWHLHMLFDFGPKRLKAFHNSFLPALKALCERYEMTDDGDEIWLCTKKLKDYGIDIEEWNKE